MTPERLPTRPLHQDGSDCWAARTTDAVSAADGSTSWTVTFARTNIAPTTVATAASVPSVDMANAPQRAPVLARITPHARTAVTIAHTLATSAVPISRTRAVVSVVSTTAG